MRQVIQVIYTCDPCGIKDRYVSVPARGDEDVLQWTEMMTQYIANDHTRMSPNCRATTITQVKVPLLTDKIGGVRE